MSTLTITLTDKAYNGLVEAGNRNGITAEAIAAELLTNQGNSYADLFQIGTITSAAFVLRFTPQEYAAIMQAAPEHPEIAGYIAQLSNQAYVPLTDPRLQPALEAMAQAGLIEPGRLDAILFYERPEPAGE